MKILYSFFLAFISYTSSSQKNFEGVITYEMDSQPGYKSELRVTYGKNHIKGEALIINGKTGQVEKNRVTIYDILNGINYKIDSEFEQIKFDSLKYEFREDIGVEFISTDSVKKILNQSCRLFSAKAIIKDTSAIIPASKFSIWFSESIKYIIPREYWNKRSLLANKEGNIIWLESKIIFMSPYSKNAIDNDTVSVRIKSIEPTTIHDSVFKLPPDYILKYISPKKDNSYKMPASNNDAMMKNFAVKPHFYTQITSC